MISIRRLLIFSLVNNFKGPSSTDRELTRDYRNDGQIGPIPNLKVVSIIKTAFPFRSKRDL